MIFIAQAIEHYEITHYRALRAWAEELGYEAAATILAQLQAQELAVDRRLAKIAMVANAASAGFR